MDILREIPALRSSADGDSWMVNLTAYGLSATAATVMEGLAVPSVGTFST